MASLRVVVCFAVLAATAVATDVDQCPGKSIENLRENVQLSPCKMVPCVLKKGTDEVIRIKFKPAQDVEDVKNLVSATVYGVDLPFIGVNGNSICEKIYTENDEKASCPLKAGTTYIYKDSFPILGFYPAIPVKVHWGLSSDGNNEFFCFEVPARIK